MKREKLMCISKWAIYYVLLIVFYALQTTPRLFEIFGVKPVLILPLIICVSMYEGVMSSAAFAVVGGLLWDISSDKLLGFNAIIFICCSVLVSLICIYYLRTNMINSLVFCFITALIQGMLDYLFYYAIWSYSNSSIILLQRILPTIGYTVILTPISYFLIRFVATKFSITTRA